MPLCRARFSSATSDNIPTSSPEREESRGEQDLTRTILTSVQFLSLSIVCASLFPINEIKLDFLLVCLWFCGFFLNVVLVHAPVHAMGRLNKTRAGSSVSVHYRKLTEDYNGSACEALKLMPTLPEYMSYCCHQCGHTQKLKVKRKAGWRNLYFFFTKKTWASTPLLFAEH